MRLKGGTKKNKVPDEYAVRARALVPAVCARTRAFLFGVPAFPLISSLIVRAVVTASWGQRTIRSLLAVRLGTRWGIAWNTAVADLCCARVAQAIQAPKRSLTAYMIFSNQVRPELMKQHPDLKITEVSKHIADRWKVL